METKYWQKKARIVPIEVNENYSKRAEHLKKDGWKEITDKAVLEEAGYDLKEAPTIPQKNEIAPGGTQDGSNKPKDNKDNKGEKDPKDDK